MVLPGLLDLSAVAVLIVSLWLMSGSTSGTGKRRQGLASVVLALVLVAGSAALNLSGLFQRATGINLGMPAPAETKARFWLEEHKDIVPSRGEVGKNMRLIEDGLAFYQAYGRYFKADAHGRMDEYARMPRKLDHVLSFAEEARYYRAADDICTMIRSLAGTEKAGTPTPAPAK